MGDGSVLERHTGGGSTGERDQVASARAAHAGPIDDDTLVYRIEFHVIP